MNLYRVKGRSLDHISVVEYVEADSAYHALELFVENMRVEHEGVTSVKVVGDRVIRAEDE